MSQFVPGSSPELRFQSPRRWRRWPVLFLTALLSLLVIPSTSQAVALPYPPLDPFYDAPADIGSYENGAVIRSRETKIRFTEAVQMPYKAYQVMYRSNDLNMAPTANSALIILPLKRPATGRKLVSYQTAYDGLTPACQPSYTLRTGKVALQALEVVLMSGALNRGWTVVTADYEGPKNQWGVYKTNAHGVLDGIRAAATFEPAGLTDGLKTPVGMLGYSGGGNATGWANEEAQTYAPELNIVGAAQGGVGADLAKVVKALDGQLFAGIAFAGIIGVTSAYPDVNLPSILNKDGWQVYKQLTSRAGSCISDFAMAFPFKRFRDIVKGQHRGFLTTPRQVQIAKENSLGQQTPTAPVFWYQTRWDQMNTYWNDRKVARQYCLDGGKVEFYTGPGNEEHAAQAFNMPFRAQDWLAKRFRGDPLPGNCASIL
jgi:Secretory lipase